MIVIFDLLLDLLSLLSVPVYAGLWLPEPEYIIYCWNQLCLEL